MYKITAETNKEKELNKVIKRLVPENCTYIEPFSDQSSLFLDLLSENKTNRVVISSQNTSVLNFWALVKEDYWALLKAISLLSSIRNDLISRGMKQNSELNKVLQLAAQDEMGKTALYYLNTIIKTKHKVRTIGDFNSIEYTGAFYNTSILMQNVVIDYCNYQSLMKYNTPDSFWYINTKAFRVNNQILKTLRDMLSTVTGKVIITLPYNPDILRTFKGYHKIKLSDIKRGIKYNKDVVLVSNYRIS